LAGGGVGHAPGEHGTIASTGTDDVSVMSIVSAVSSVDS